MKLTKRKKAAFPLLAKPTNGKKLIIPNQKKFSNDWLRAHGCSIVAEYIALQWGGIKKSHTALLNWHKKNTPEYIKSKVTLRGIAEGINKIGKGKLKATFYSEPTTELITKAIEKRRLVIFEQGSPIHSVVLIPDADGVYVASNGTVKRTLISTIIKKATKNKTYRGMIVVKSL